MTDDDFDDERLDLSEQVAREFEAGRRRDEERNEAFLEELTRRNREPPYRGPFIA